MNGQKNEFLDAIIGCRVRTHYGSELLIAYYCGPHEMYGPGSWTVGYKDERGHVGAHLNSIKTDGGVITCEGRPLEILGREAETQTSLF